MNTMRMSILSDPYFSESQKVPQFLFLALCASTFTFFCEIKSSLPDSWFCSDSENEVETGGGGESKWEVGARQDMYCVLHNPTSFHVARA